MKKEVRLYNAFFPIWFLIFFPIVWLIVLPVNFLIDSLVLIVICKSMKFDNIKVIYKKSILKVWVFGFIADLIGAGFLLLSEMFDRNEWWSKNVLTGVYYNPFHSVYSFIYVLLAAFIAGFFIFVLNYYFSFSAFELDDKTKAKMALWIAILTIPYLFFYPTGYPKLY